MLLILCEGFVKMGVIINGIVIVICSLIGMGLKAGIPVKIHERLMHGIALCVLAIGIDGTLAGENTIVMILSIVVGAMIGESIDIDQKVTYGISLIEKKISKPGSDSQLGQGFISAAMIFCIGSMSILGSLESGLTGDNTTLYTKSILDGITAILLSSSLGAGVLLSAIPVIIIQGLLVILAGFLAPILSVAVVNEIIAVGSLLLIGLGMNILNITELKILNYTPAIFLPPIFLTLLSLF
ncbi:DUF554 domain-containing protein [Facklamia sp. P13064]|uniref:DUF554 domain-containing protein n=1 Tax=unclassified Facklamia TaxID=2622293 RepID=UPI003D17DFD6